VDETKDEPGVVRPAAHIVAAIVRERDAARL